MVNIIKSRKDKKLFYKDENLIYFFDWLLAVIKDISNQGFSHSCLIPNNLVLTEGQQRMYRVCGINSLFYADMNERRYYFMRNIEEKD